MAVAKRQIAQLNIQNKNHPVRRIVHRDRSESRLDAYAKFVVELSKKFTSSKEEADATKKEIFLDILRFAQRSKVVPTYDEHLASLIARRRLAKYLA